MIPIKFSRNQDKSPLMYSTAQWGYDNKGKVHYGWNTCKVLLSNEGRVASHNFLKCDTVKRKKPSKVLEDHSLST